MKIRYGIITLSLCLQGLAYGSDRADNGGSLSKTVFTQEGERLIEKLGVYIHKTFRPDANAPWYLPIDGMIVPYDLLDLAVSERNLEMVSSDVEGQPLRDVRGSEVTARSVDDYPVSPEVKKLQIDLNALRADAYWQESGIAEDGLSLFVLHEMLRSLQVPDPEMSVARSLLRIVQSIEATPRDASAVTAHHHWLQDTRSMLRRSLAESLEPLDYEADQKYPFVHPIAPMASHFSFSWDRLDIRTPVLAAIERTGNTPHHRLRNLHERYVKTPRSSSAQALELKKVMFDFFDLRKPLERLDFLREEQISWGRDCGIRRFHFKVIEIDFAQIEAAEEYLATTEGIFANFSSYTYPDYSFQPSDSHSSFLRSFTWEDRIQQLGLDQTYFLRRGVFDGWNIDSDSDTMHFTIYVDAENGELPALDKTTLRDLILAKHCH